MYQTISKYWTQIYQAFKSESGNYVLIATVISRLSTFIGAWIALQMIDNVVLGEAIYAYQFVVFTLPFIGFGLHQGLLRFGAQLQTDVEKNEMFRSVFRIGLLVSIVLGVLICVGSGILTFRMPEAQKHLQLFSLVLISSFMYETLRAQFRILHQNKNYAFSEITYSLLFLLLIAVMSSFWGIDGYIWSFIIAPLFSFSIWVNKVGLNSLLVKSTFTPSRNFWTYGFFASLGNVLTQLLFVIDILLIGNLLNNSNDVTIYKYLTLVPFSVLFLSHVYMTTHFVQVTKQITKVSFVMNFIKNYHILFSVLTIGFLFVAWVFKDHILTFFDPDFASYSFVFMTLCIGASGILLLRGLYGNLLSALGFANVNFIIALLGLILNIVLNYYWIPKYGIQGAAFTSAVIMWFTGFLSAAFFFFLLKRETNNL